jgi:hypothetical protein
MMGRFAQGGFHLGFTGLVGQRFQLTHHILAFLDTLLYLLVLHDGHLLLIGIGHVFGIQAVVDAHLNVPVRFGQSIAGPVVHHVVGDVADHLSALGTPVNTLLQVILINHCFHLPQFSYFIVWEKRR